jgi:hypothetical protein
MPSGIAHVPCGQPIELPARVPIVVPGSAPNRSGPVYMPMMTQIRLDEQLCGLLTEYEKESEIVGMIDVVCELIAGLIVGAMCRIAQAVTPLTQRRFGVTLMFDNEAHLIITILQNIFQLSGLKEPDRAKYLKLCESEIKDAGLGRVDGFA